MKPAREAIRPSDALLIVDVQNDFCEGGALPVPAATAVIPVLNDWIEAALAEGIPIVASRDWHPAEHPSFEEMGGMWPRHCIQDSDGAAFHRDLHLPESTLVITKGVRFDKDQYSAFDETGLADALRRRGVERIWLGGLAQDVCVAATAIDANAAGFDVHLIAEATRPISDESGDDALQRLRERGVTVET